MYHIGISLDRDLFHNWIAEAETKVVCRAKNKNDLLKAVKIAEELGWEENKDYWLIYDACRTELEREGPDVYWIQANGGGRNSALYLI